MTALTMALVALFMGVSNGYGAAPVDLGTAGNFVILAKTGVSTTAGSDVVGNIGVSPAAAGAITGFDLIMDASGTFSTSGLVTGQIFAADYTEPTPTMLTTAIGDMETAYTTTAGLTPDSTELHAGDLSGQTIYPGTYYWSSAVLINSGLTLSGGPDDVWIFQIAQDLTLGNGAMITLSGGAQAKNIFWQVAGQTTLGTTSDFKGTILCMTAIVVQTGAAFTGSALAQTAVTLDAAAIATGVEQPMGSELALNKLQLMPCRPNPVSGAAIISYVLPRAGTVSLNVYDICGRKVNTLVQGQKQAGAYNLTWSGSDRQGRRLSSGVYFYRLNYEGASLTRRLVLLR
jgi:hypothetical protein